MRISKRFLPLPYGDVVITWSMRYLLAVSDSRSFGLKKINEEMTMLSFCDSLIIHDVMLWRVREKCAGVRYTGNILISVTTPHIAHSIEELPGGYISWMLQPEHLLHNSGVKTEWKVEPSTSHERAACSFVNAKHQRSGERTHLP